MTEAAFLLRNLQVNLYGSDTEEVKKTKSRAAQNARVPQNRLPSAGFFF
jgi:hypothetical protein